MKKAFIDVESYYDNQISVQEMCMKKYISKSYAYLVSVVTDDGIRWAGTFNELMAEPVLIGVLFSPEYELWAVNANFDQMWVEHYIPALIGKKTWRCVSDFSVYHQRPRSLANAHKALFGETISKSVRNSMKGVHVNEVFSFEADYWKEYNLKDSDDAKKVCDSLLSIGEMSVTEQAVSAHTRQLCRRGIAVDEEFAESMRQTLMFIRFDAEKKLPWAKTKPVLSAEAFNSYCCERGVAPPMNLRKTDDGFEAWKNLNPTLAPILNLRQQWELANRKLSHLETIASRTVEGIYYPDILYCGAPHTRRFSSKGSSDEAQGDALYSTFNIQNMDRSPIFGDVLTDWFSPLPPVKKGKKLPGLFFRNLMVPRPGKKFVIFDFSQIEPRCLHWLVRDEQWLESVRAGFNPYEALARKTTGWEGKPGTLSSTDDALYRLSKAQELGLGYGCGTRKFPVVAKTLAGVIINEEGSKKAVYGWRDANKPVTGFWDDCHQLVVDSYTEGTDLDITMPNGEVYHRFNTRMQMRYQDFYDREQGRMVPREKPEYFCEKTYGQPEERSTYGAKVVENIVQRMGRDLLVEAILRCEAAGIPCVFHAHDEAIFEVDADNAKDACDETRQLFTTVPDWAWGIPIAVSGGIFDRYTKD